MRLTSQFFIFMETLREKQTCKSKIWTKMSHVVYTCMQLFLRSYTKYCEIDKNISHPCSKYFYHNLGQLSYSSATLVRQSFDPCHDTHTSWSRYVQACDPQQVKSSDFRTSINPFLLLCDYVISFTRHSLKIRCPEPTIYVKIAHMLLFKSRLLIGNLHLKSHRFQISVGIDIKEEPIRTHGPTM